MASPEEELRAAFGEIEWTHIVDFAGAMRKLKEGASASEAVELTAGEVKALIWGIGKVAIGPDELAFLRSSGYVGHGQ